MEHNGTRAQRSVAWIVTAVTAAILILACLIIHGKEYFRFEVQGVIPSFTDADRQRVKEKLGIDIPERAVFLEGAYIGWQDTSTIYLFEMDISQETDEETTGAMDLLLHDLFAMDRGWDKHSHSPKEHPEDWNFPIAVEAYDNELCSSWGVFQYALSEDGQLRFCVLIFS